MKHSRIANMKTSGVALILVLAFLVLITGLVLAFFSSVSTELTSAKSYSSAVSSKQLADSTTQLVIASIRNATAGGATVAWASQPGMIRTFDNSGAAATACYKLFSSDTLQTTGTYDPTTDIDPMWEGKTAVFTDLNAPVKDSNGTDNFPIVNPTAQGLVDGFSINATAPLATIVQNLAPMPVKWIYMLKDGSLVTPVTPAASTTSATFSGAIVPSVANPIVGRIAYWTDDDSCKVNINTASEGVYWDIPRLTTAEDLGVLSGTDASNLKATSPGLALCQPTTGEFQRFPGHPATTSLSPIFGNLGLPPPSSAPSAGNVPLLKA